MKRELEEYFDRLWPINRSLTGEGNRDSLKIINEIVDLNILEVPSGSDCFDWTVPPEWNIKEAWIKDDEGNKIIDFETNNLHVLGYSTPVHEKLSFNALEKHLYTLPEQPDLIPYLTSYYKERWGFCLSHNDLVKMDASKEYEVFIDSSLDFEGSMTIGEAVLDGISNKEILISTYICHPSMANNELSGPLVSTFLYKALKEKKDRKYTYRFLFIPETIGSIYMLSKYGAFWRENLIGGYVVTCIGDKGSFTYKKSRLGDSISDRAAQLILKQTYENHTVVDFFPGGSDERQYCSPGFNLPIGSLMRTMYGKYNEYHTSGDNKSIMSFENMVISVERYCQILELIEKNATYVSTNPNCEPQLGKRGLYPTLGSQKEKEGFVNAMMWVLNLADGEHDLIQIAERSGLEVQTLYPVVDKLIEKGLLKEKTS